jgi:CRP-like cAMP-binding protein
MTLERDIEILTGVPFLADVPAEPLRLVAFSAERRELGPGDVLFRAGDTAEGGFLVMAGRIDLLEDRDGTRRVVVQAGPGMLIGEMALLVETERPATAVAGQRSVVHLIRRSTFRRVLEEYPAVTLTLQQRVLDRLASLDPAIESIARRLEALDRD